MSPLKEIDIYGVFIPPLLAWGTVSLIAVKFIRTALEKRGFYRSDVERQVFDVALFVVLTSLLSFCVV
jgi:hypothetical protein